MRPHSPFVLQTRGFWMFLLPLSLLAAIAAFRLLFLVEPGLNVDVSFSRQQALDAAAAFQQQRFPDLATRRTAVLFGNDRNFQNYIELEGGGSEAYQTLIHTPEAATHHWQVRAFTPGQKHELHSWYSPSGTLQAYRYLLPEDEGSAALDETAARALAEAGARDLLGSEFADYAALDTRQEEQTSGRRDYTFTYEHATLQPGEARIRLILSVAGDQLVAVQRSKFTPEAFGLRFGELRKLNTQLSTIASVLMLALFGLGGLLGGGIWLFRRHQLQFRYGLIPGVITALGLAAAQIANMPIAWMSYQTQDAEQSFIAQQLAQTGIVLVAAGLMLGVIYAVAEGLTRHAFAGQPRLWDSLRAPVIGSTRMAGRILGAYAWTGFFLLYALLFLLFSSRVLGWWQPSSLNVDPNVLASWRPALAPIFNALQAGTWEECLFRAIPLSIAVMLDRRWGSGRKLTLLMLVVQALIFGAGHANYPQLPGYSRVVELFIPAMAFGLVFLRFGLVPCMLTHFLYDLTLMSMPIFLAEDSGLWLDRALVILAGAAPLLLLARVWQRQGGLQPLPTEYLNGAPPAPPPVAAVDAIRPPPAHAATAWQPRQLWLLALAAAGLLLGTAASLQQPRVEWPEFSIPRQEALQRAEAALAAHGVQLGGEWRSTVRIDNGRRASFDFVWRESGPTVAQQLLGSYAEGPHWNIVWRRFDDGPVEERAELWQVQLRPDGTLQQIIHQLPEGRPGARLDQAAAEALARRHVDTLGWTPAGGLALHSIAETERPARSDWVVTLADPASYQHAGAVAVSGVRIAGDEVVGYYRSLDIPESWVRERAAQNSQRQPWRIANIALALVLVGCALSTFFRRHSGRRFDFGAALPWILLTLVPLLVLTWLRIDNMTALFQATMGWTAQLGLQLGALAVSAALLGIVIAMAAQAVYAERPHAGATFRSEALLGAALGMGVLGLGALGSLLLRSSEPPDALVADWATPLPVLAAVLNACRNIASTLFVAVLLLGFTRFVTQRWQFWLLAGLGLLWWISGAMMGSEWWLRALGSLPTLLSAVLGYMLIRRGHMGATLALLGTIAVFRQWALGNALYPTAWLHAAQAFVVSAAALAYLLRHWLRRCA